MTPSLRIFQYFLWSWRYTKNLFPYHAIEVVRCIGSIFMTLANPSFSAPTSTTIVLDCIRSDCVSGSTTDRFPFSSCNVTGNDHSIFVPHNVSEQAIGAILFSAFEHCAVGAEILCRCNIGKTCEKDILSLFPRKELSFFHNCFPNTSQQKNS